MTSFWRYLGGTLVGPRSTFTRLLTDPHQLAQGSAAVLLIGVLYTLTVTGLAVVGAAIVTPAWVNIPAEDYYFWETLFAMPVFVVGWIVAAGLVQVLSKPFRGAGTFEHSLAALGFAMAVPSFVTWVPETLGTVLFLTGTMSQTDWLALTAPPGSGKVFADGYQPVALAWYLILFPVAVASAQKLRWWQATMVGTVTLAIVGFFMFIFVR